MVELYNLACGYDIGALKDYVYLIKYSDAVFTYEVDNGNCGEIKVNNLNETYDILKLNGTSVQMKAEEEESGRLKFSTDVTMYVAEEDYGIVNDLIKERYFVIVEDKKGVQYVQSVEYYSELNYSFTIENSNNNPNRIKLTFKGSSNFPSMVMGENVEATSIINPHKCDYSYNKAYSLKIGLAPYTSMRSDTMHNISSITVGDAQDFRLVDFMKTSFKFEESYSNGSYTTQLSFTIPLNDYKRYWSYRLVEFPYNKYVVTWRTAEDCLYATGFDFGMDGTYLIETSTSAGVTNKITITLTYSSDWSLYRSNKADKDIYDVDGSLSYIPAPPVLKNQLTRMCVDDGEAVIMLVERLRGGVSYDEYLCLEGYESMFEDYFNIVGTYAIDEENLGFPIFVPYSDCNGYDPCHTITDIQNIYNLTQEKNRYFVAFTSKCDYTISGVIPTWLSVTKTTGGFTIALKASPTYNTIARFSVKSGGNTYSVTVTYTMPSWNLVPSVPQISCDTTSFMVGVNFMGYTKPMKEEVMRNITPVSCTSDNGREGIIAWRGNGWLVTIPKYMNENATDITWTFIADDKITQKSCTVRQVNCYQDVEWRLEGFVCDDGNLWQNYQKYFKGEPTGEYRKGKMTQYHADICDQYYYRWRNVEDDYVCEGTTMYQLEVEEKSLDGEIWVETGATRAGRLIEEESEDCGFEPDYDDRFILRMTKDTWQTQSTHPDWELVLTKPLENFDVVEYRYKKGTVRAVSGLFSNWTTIEQVAYSPITAAVTDLSGLFYRCTSLTSFQQNVRDTSKVTSLTTMFSGCSKLETVSFSDFDMSSVTSAGLTFAGCSNLRSVYVNEKFFMPSITYNFRDTKIFMDEDGLDNGTWNDFYRAAVEAREMGIANCSFLFPPAFMNASWARTYIQNLRNAGYSVS